MPMPLKEFDLLEILVRNSGRVLTRAQLIDRCVGVGLRRGHQDAGCAHQTPAGQSRSRILRTPLHLVTVRGLGYKYDA